MHVDSKSSLCYYSPRVNLRPKQPEKLHRNHMEVLNINKITETKEETGTTVEFVVPTTQVILGKDRNNPKTEQALKMGYEPFTPRPEYYLAYVTEQNLDPHFIWVHGIKVLDENGWRERISPLRRRAKPIFSPEAQMKYEEAQKSKVFHHIMAAFLKDEIPYLVGYIQINGKPVMFGEFRKNLQYLPKHISANGISFLIYTPQTLTD